MVRKLFKKKKRNSKVDAFITKYNIKPAYLSVNRKSVANAMLVGLFFGFIPMPMQMLAVVLSTFFLTFNVPLAVSLVWITNPLTMPIIFYVEYLIGNFFLLDDNSVQVQLTLEWFTNNMDAIFLPLYLGAAICAVSFAFLGYTFIHVLWKRSVFKEKTERDIA